MPVELFRDAHHACLMWVEQLQCGIDLFDQSHYQLPAHAIDTFRRIPA